MKCNCYYCRVYGECDERDHPPEYIVKAKHKDGRFYWGRGVEKAKGRWVNLCRWCVEAFDDDSGWCEAAMNDLRTKLSEAEEKCDELLKVIAGWKDGK